jgi:serine/threonine-protein kinase
MGYVELVFRREGRFLRWCARKRLHEQHRSDPTFRSMFLDEARLAGLIHHPNAVGVLDVGADDEGPFFIMEFVEGVPLSRMIAQATAAGRRIPLQVAVRVCMDAARGLHAAHEVRAEDGTVLRLVHRDVSPQNILIGFDGTVRVTDFGIAKAMGNSTRTSAGVLKGNMGYLAPEQLRFEEPDRRSDLFSLGVTLYEILSGQRLYPNTAGFDGTRRILAEPAPDIGDVRNDVPAELCELLFELLAKDRDSRPATAAEIASRLEGVLALLIGDEGSVTVGDYMDQHFGEVRQQQRADLAAHLARIESHEMQASVPRAENRQARARPLAARPAVFVALAAATAVAVVGWSTFHRREAPSPVATTTATTTATTIAATSPALPLVAAPRTPDPSSSPANPASAPVARNEAETRPVAKRATAKTPHRVATRSARSPQANDQDRSPRVTAKDRHDAGPGAVQNARQGARHDAVLSVPLFERWQ